MKGAFISDVDLGNGEGRIDGNEGVGYNEDFFFCICFCFRCSCFRSRILPRENVAG